jgi:HSP20 family protein
MTYVKHVPARKTSSENRNALNRYKAPVDIVESKDDYRLTFDLPGFGKENVSVTVKEGLLEVSGERKDEGGHDENYFQHFERNHGEFKRSFRLPEFVDGDSIGAEYTNGVLILTLPKKEEAKPYSVKIK